MEKNITLIVTEQEAQALFQIIDAALKHSGIVLSVAGAVWAQKIQDAQRKRDEQPK